MRQSSVCEHILANENNLRIAAEVVEAWPDARGAIVDSFLKTLGDRLKNRLPGWKSEPYQRFFVEANPNFSVWKPAWENQYYISLYCGEYGKKMQIGFLRERDALGKRPLSSDLLKAVQEVYPSAHSSEWWEAIAVLHSPAVDWTKPEVLWRIYKDPRFLADVVSQFVELAEVGERIVDALVRKGRQKRPR